jgi:UPF0755 protein
MVKKLLLGSVLLVLGFGIAATIAVVEIAKRIETPYLGYDTSGVFVDIDLGDSSRLIAERLASLGVVKDNLSFRLAVWRSGQARNLQAGEYHFNEQLSAMEVVEKITRGQVHLRSITFPEGLAIAEMAIIFDSSSFGSAAEFLSAAQRVDLIIDLDNDATNLEGYLFPDTYLLPRGATAEDLVSAMLLRFRVVFDTELFQVLANREMSLREAVTLASLIQKETSDDTEHGLVSAVYNNRLRIGMPLQCDPTVIYALILDGLYDGNLTRDNLQYDSLYNTYRYRGLPPGPIASPGLDALMAALSPSDVSYLYFVSRNDGSHEFANTLREHNRNVQRYQVEYFRGR